MAWDRDFRKLHIIHRKAVVKNVIVVVQLLAAAAAKSHQSCLTQCDPIDGSTPGSPVPGILQARTLEWVAISFSNARKWNVKVKSLGRVQLFETPWTVAYQAPPSTSLGFSRQEYWSGLPLLSCVQFFATPRTAARQASLSSLSLGICSDLMLIELVMLSNYLILCRPLLLLPSIFPSIRVFSNELALQIRLPEYWSLNFSTSPSNEYSKR